MNNRKPRNKRGKITRQNFIQEITEKPTIIRKGKEVANPRYPGKTFIVHQQAPKYSGANLWGKQ